MISKAISSRSGLQALVAPLVQPLERTSSYN